MLICCELHMHVEQHCLLTELAISYKELVLGK